MGTKQLGLWFGNSVFTYDEHPPVRLTGPISRSLEQITMILVGEHPRLKVLPTDENRRAIARMYRARNPFFVGVLAVGLLCVTLVVQLRRHVRATREARVARLAANARNSLSAGLGTSNGESESNVLQSDKTSSRPTSV